MMALTVMEMQATQSAPLDKLFTNQNPVMEPALMMQLLMTLITRVCATTPQLVATVATNAGTSAPGRSGPVVVEM